MRTIEWQENDIAFEDENQLEAPTTRIKGNMEEEHCNQACQLRKYKDPSQDAERQNILSVIEAFGILLAAGEFEKIAENLLTEDFEGFRFNFTHKASIQHCTGPTGFIELFKNNKIQFREVKIANVDSEKSAAWQACEYTMINEGQNNPVTEIACEVFTIKDKRISKYRASSGSAASGFGEFEKFLMPTRKDKMLAKIKGINYALAGQPDFEKIASLLNDDTEYRIWRWEDHKCFTLYKSDLQSSFENLQENMSIRSVVPYELSVDSQQKFISGTYAYHLEEKCTGTKFVWLSTCIYSFDHEVNLIKISQQGELYPEEDIEIPFESYSRESLVKIVNGILHSFDQGFDVFYQSTVLYDCLFYSILPKQIPNPGCYSGMKHIDQLQLLMDSSEELKIDSFQLIDIYVDQQSEVYDAVLAIACADIIMKCENNRKESHMYFGICSMENGKLAKQIEWASELPGPVPSSIQEKK